MLRPMEASTSRLCVDECQAEVTCLFGQSSPEVILWFLKCARRAGCQGKTVYFADANYSFRTK